MAKYYAFTEETLLAHDKEIVKKTKEAIQAHADNKNNPHAVTAAQVGAYSKEETASMEQLNAAFSHIPMIYNGTTEPDDDLGRDGDLYIWWKIELPI